MRQVLGQAWEVKQHIKTQVGNGSRYIMKYLMCLTLCKSKQRAGGQGKVSHANFIGKLRILAGINTALPSSVSYYSSAICCVVESEQIAPQVFLLIKPDTIPVDFLRCLKYKSCKSESNDNASHVPTLQKNDNRFLI